MEEIEKIKQTYQEINAIQEEISKLYEIGADYEKIDNALHQLYFLKVNLQSLEKNIYLQMQPSIVGEKIDLYLKNIHATFEKEPDEFHYLITLHNTKTIIGKIDVRFHLLESERDLGNIGATIEEAYRGNRYVGQAFSLLHDVMLENGLSKPILTAHTNNISSIRSIQSMGAKLMGKDVNEDGPYYIYQVDLDERTKKI